MSSKTENMPSIKVHLPQADYRKLQSMAYQLNAHSARLCSRWLSERIETEYQLFEIGEAEEAES